MPRTDQPSRLNTFGLAILFVAFAAQVMARKNSDYECPDPNTVDPQLDMCNPFRYIPNLGANAAFCALYGIAAILFTINQIRNNGKGKRYFLCLVIGTWCETLGIALRLAMRSNPHSSGVYIVMYLFVVLPPCAFLAADYILLGRMVRHLDADRYLPLKPEKVSTIFVISDVITFLIQASGGGVSAMHDPQLAQIGSRIFLAGLSAQLASFAFFTFLWLVFTFRASRDEFLWKQPGWKRLNVALGFTCVMFLIRSLFRTIELSQGYVGYLATHEIYYLLLDALPLWLGIMIYAYFWPTRYLTEENRVIPGDMQLNQIKTTGSPHDSAASNQPLAYETQWPNEAPKY